MLVNLYTSSELLSRVQIRVAQAEDLPALEWEGEYAHFRRLYREIFHMSKTGQAVLWVADMIGTGIIGQIFVQLSSSRQVLADGVSIAYFYSFRVRLPYQGYGIGSHMLEVAESDLIARGFRSACLNVNRGNTRAINFYRERGYRIVAQEPGNWSYRDDKDKLIQVHEPAWRMEKPLVCNQ